MRSALKSRIFWIIAANFLTVLFRHLTFFVIYGYTHGLIWTWFCRSILLLHAFSSADRWSDCWFTYNESESPVLLEFENWNSEAMFGQCLFRFWLSFGVYASECIIRYLHVSECIFFVSFRTGWKDTKRYIWIPRL